MVGSEQTALYSCKCINVQLKCSTPPSNPAQSDLPPAADWTTVFVPQDEDIKIIYPHLTLRSRHRGPYIPDPSRCARYTSLTCLFCQTLVYRIHQAVLLNDEVNIREGPIITKGWAETEVLRSSSGWLEVFKDVLAGEKAVNQQKNLPQFSDLFGIVLPAASASPSPSPAPEPEPSSSQAQSVPKYQLPPIPAIFPEPKSTRSLFAILAAIATRHSNAMRAEAEEYIDGIVKEKVAEIKRAETLLKRNVQILLTAYSDGIKKAEQEQYALGGSNSGTNENIPSPPASPSTPRFTGVPSSVVRDFVPMILSPSPPTASTTSDSSRPIPKPSSSSVSASLPRVSALSASLATSAFHHPKARAEASGTRSPDAASLQSLQSASTATLTAPQDFSHVFQFSRNVNDDINTASSFRVLQLEDEMKRRQMVEEKKKESLQGPGAGAGSATRIAGPSNAPAPPARADAKRDRLNGKAQEKEEDLDVPLSPKAKGKRKVTFDVQVDTPDKPTEDPAANLDSGEMMFDLEEETNERDTKSAYDAYSNEMVLPLVEPTSQQPMSGRPRITKRTSSGNGGIGGLPASFSALRPASLPAPSHIPLPIRIQDTAAPSDTTATEQGLENANNRADSVSSPTQALDRERNANILNMLAATLPSHRAAWAGADEDGVYKAFVRGASAVDEDEDDVGSDDDTQAERMKQELSLAGIPSSLPIGIHRPSKPRAPPLSLASYQPDAVLADNLNQNGHSDNNRGRTMSSGAMRRAVYAERDVERGIDPGALDYVLGVPREEDEFTASSDGSDEGEAWNEEKGMEGQRANGSTPRGVNGTSTGRSGRDRAHKILESQAKSEIPDDGMWRSLV